MISDRLMAAVRALIASEVPELPYLATWEYAVAHVNDDGTVDGVATATIPLPAMNRVPVAALAAGGVSRPTVGTTFLVDFLRSDGTLYAVLSVEPTVAVATLDAEQTVRLAPTAANPLELGPAEKATARTGDSLQLFFPLGILNGTLTTGSGTVPVAGLPCSVLTPAPGIITSGQARVLA